MTAIIPCKCGKCGSEFKRGDMVFYRAEGNMRVCENCRPDLHPTPEIYLPPQKGITANCLLNSPAECEKGEARRRVEVLGILNKNSFPVTVGALITLMELAWKHGWCSGVRQTCDFELPPITAPETAPESGGGGGAARIDDGLGGAPRMFDGALAYQPNIAVPSKTVADNERNCVKAVYDAFTLNPKQSEQLLADMTEAARKEFIQVFSVWLCQRTCSRTPPENSEIAGMAWELAHNGQAREAERKAQSHGM